MKNARFLALGDSYTIGEAAPPQERWCQQLAGRIRHLGTTIEDPVIIARTGWTTDELKAAIDEVSPDRDYDLVSVLVGVNNQYRGRSLENYDRELNAILEIASACARGDATRVIVLSIPDWGVTPFAEGRDRHKIAGEIDAFNAVKRTASQNIGATYVDITPSTREAATDSSLLASDGLHPSGKMYAKWADHVLPVAMRILQR